jgi:hypothetical protein
MDGSWDNDEFIYFGDDEIGMMLDLRRYRNHKGSFPSHNEYRDWEDARYSLTEMRNFFGPWNNAMRAVGGPTNFTEPKNKKNSRKDIKDGIIALAEIELEYKVEGESFVSNEGQAVPAHHIEHIDLDRFDLDMEPTSYMSINRKLDRSYVEFVQHKGFSHPSYGKSNGISEEYDWQDVKQELIEDIQKDFTWRNQRFKEDEVPPPRYFDASDKYPRMQTMRDRFGKREEWPEELGIRESRNATDVNVDITDFED